MIGIWGNKKAYIVFDVLFEKNPFTLFFADHQGEKMSIAEYFQKTYQLKCTAKQQPLFLVKINGKDAHLPTEFCTVDGVPQAIREDPRRMKTVLAASRKNPHEKFEAIQEFCKNLFGQKALKDWGITIEPEPVQAKSTILPTPQLYSNKDNLQYCDQNSLRAISVQNAKRLKKG